MRDAVRSTNGEVTNAFPKDNQPKTWVFWIKPLYNETIRVELLPTTDCEAEGAICTEDGRPLSNRAFWDIMPRDPNAVDETAPAFLRAEVDGAQLVLLYRDGLDEDATPAADAFTVTVGGQTRDLASSDPVAVDGRRVRLTLASAVASGDSVRVSYAVPAENPIQDRAGNAVVALSDQAVTNHTPEGDTTAPAFEVAVARRDSVVLTYSEALDEASTPGVDAFTVTVGGQTRDLASSDPVVVSGLTVMLRLASAVASGDSVRVSYAVPSENPIQDRAGNAVAALSDQAVTNHTPESDTTAPAFEAAVARRDSVVLTYSEALDETSTPGVDAFTVTVGGQTRDLAVSDPVVVSGLTVTLRFASAAVPGDSVRVSYAVPSENPIQDRAGNRAAPATITAKIPAPKFTVKFEEGSLPKVHDGVGPIEFRIVFSEEPASSYNYMTLRYKTLIMRLGPRAYNAKRGYKLDPPSGKRWGVVVERRKSDAEYATEDFTITINPTQNCNDEGAVCTEDGRKLSNRLFARIKGPPVLSMADTEVTEAADATAAFEVTLSRAVADTVTVDYATSDGTATAGEDYEETSGTLTFVPGETSKTVSVPVLNDSVSERAESFTLTLSNHSGAKAYLAEARATGDILDDEPSGAISATVTSEPGANGTWDTGETVVVEVRFIRPVQVQSSSNVKATVGIALDGTRREAAFVSGSATDILRFEYPVTASDDGSQQVRIVSNEIALNGVTIQDTDGRVADVAFGNAPELSVADVTVMEGTDASAEFVVTLSPAAVEAVTVDYTTSDGTATAGEDYTSTSGTLTFNAGETSKTVSVPVLDDTVDERSETFTLTLSNASGGDAYLSDATATGTINNDDSADPPSGNTVVLEPEEPRGARDIGTITLTADTPGTIQASWEAPTEAPANYRITWAKQGEGYKTWTDNTGNAYPTEPSYTITDLEAGEEYKVKIRASYSGTSGGWSGEATITVAGSPPTNDPPDNDPPDNDPVEPLTAEFRGLPASHGESAFTFELHFSEEFNLSYRTLRDHALQVTNGELTGVARQETGKNQAWNVTVTPDNDQDVTITLLAADCGETGAICTEDNRPLSATVSATVLATVVQTVQNQPPDTEPDPLTASFGNVPSSHDGSSAFKFELHFSEDVVGLSYKTLRDNAFTVTGGEVTKAGRLVSGNNQGWEITVAPDTHDAVTISLPAGAVETSDGRQLQGTVSATVQGPPGLSVADATVQEAANATVDFAVTLSRALSETVTVDYATSDGTATVGVDYTSTSGTLTFNAGQTEKTISVPVLDDAIDEGSETFTLTLSNASGGNAYLSDADATGTIENIDPMPKGLLARFGRTAALQVVEYVEERLQARRESGFEGRLAGHQLGRAEDMVRDVANRFVYGLGGYGSHNPSLGRRDVGMASSGSSFGLAGMLRSLFRMGDVLTGSSFTLNREMDRGGVFSFWSRGARSSFFGREDDLGLDGTVRTAMLGTDYAKGPFLVGLSLSRSWGLGSYTGGVFGGRVASSVTGLYPWLGYRLTDRMTVWAVGGYGVGGMLLSQEDASQLSAGLSMSLAAVGTRGELIGRGGNGFRLSYKADALWVGTSSEAVSGSSGNLAATRSVVSRVRTALEGSHVLTFRSRLSLSPSVMVGLRHDGGDAETGSGLDIAGGLVVSDPLTGLEVDMRVRTLLIHEAEGYRERGMAVSLRYNPSPSTPLGLTMRMSPSWGGQATSGAEALWGRPTMSGIAGGGYATGNRLDADLGYGLALGRRFVGTPRLGFATSAQGRDYRVGYGIGTLVSEGLRFELNLDAHRRASPLSIGADNGITGRATIGW